MPNPDHKNLPRKSDRPQKPATLDDASSIRILDELVECLSQASRNQLLAKIVPREFDDAIRAAVGTACRRITGKAAYAEFVSGKKPAVSAGRLSAILITAYLLFSAVITLNGWDLGLLVSLGPFAGILAFAIAFNYRIKQNRLVISICESLIGIRDPERNLSGKERFDRMKEVISRERIAGVERVQNIRRAAKQWNSKDAVRVEWWGSLSRVILPFTLAYTFLAIVLRWSNII